MISRDKESNLETALEKIVSVLNNYELTKTVDWILKTCIDW